MNTTSLGLSKKLRDEGVLQGSHFTWRGIGESYSLRCDRGAFMGDVVSSFLADELIERLPARVEVVRGQYLNLFIIKRDEAEGAEYRVGYWDGKDVISSIRSSTILAEALGDLLLHITKEMKKSKI